jgi:hypothetical protein
MTQTAGASPGGNGFGGFVWSRAPGVGILRQGDIFGFDNLEDVGKVED